MPLLRLFRYPILLLLLHSCVRLQALEILLQPDRESGLYAPGEKVTWTITLKGKAKGSLNYEVKSGGLKRVAGGSLNSALENPSISASADATDWLLLEVSGLDETDKPVKALGGACFAPEGFKASAAAPEDFDAFWKAKLAELAVVPAQPLLTTAPSNREGVDYALIQMNHIRGSHIQGQLARPSKGKHFPALLIVQWAGVYSLDPSWVLDRASEGWLVLNIQAHDLPAIGPKEFYKEQETAGRARNYPAQGNEDRDTSYFLRMYLSCYRAADYLSSRQDWDGQVLVVTGGSQGGLQALLTGALHPRVTGVIANVPAGCDQTGPEVGRMPGWPMWAHQSNGKDPQRVRATSLYYDIVHFTPRLRCPVLIGVGLLDVTCPPPGIYAAFNAIQGRKEIVPMALYGHSGKHEAFQERSKLWMNALREGKVP